jgi:hypothetical protein
MIYISKINKNDSYIGDSYKNPSRWHRTIHQIGLPSNMNPLNIWPHPCYWKEYICVGVCGCLIIFYFASFLCCSVSIDKNRDKKSPPVFESKLV